MSKRAKPYDAEKLFLQGLMAFSSFFTGRFNTGQAHRTKDEDRRRRKSHAQFKAQRIARREQRRLAA